MDWRKVFLKNENILNKKTFWIKKHLPFHDVLYYCVFLYFATARQGLPYVTKEVDNSEKPYSSLNIDVTTLDQWKN